MLNAHYKPSDSIIERIREVARIYILEGDLSRCGSMRYAICEDICKEIGIDHTAKNNLVSVLPAYNYHFDKYVDMYLEYKHRGTIDGCEVK